MSLNHLQNTIAINMASQDDKSQNFDVIVIGVGSMGASTCYYLAKQGLKVLGLEQFSITHEKGSHSGQSRIIRKAYFELPKYVPLLERAYNNWQNFEEETETQLFYKTGLLHFSCKDHYLLKGVNRSADQYNIPTQELSNQAIKEKYPQFTIPNDFIGVFEPLAGFIKPELAILNFVNRAMELGAIIKTNENVIEWSDENGIIKVETSKQTYYSKKLVVCSGAWLPKIIPQLQTKLKVTKQLLAWLEPHDSSLFQMHNFPCWNMADPKGEGLYYGFPCLPTKQFGQPQGLKIAHHFMGSTVDPDHENMNGFNEEEEKIRNFCNAYLPNAFKSLNIIKKCLYTNTTDENFIIDHHPENNNVVIAGGFSGHGFKFSSVIGEILADLVIKGTTKHPIGFLNINRLLT